MQKFMIKFISVAFQGIRTENKISINLSKKLKKGHIEFYIQKICTLNCFRVTSSTLNMKRLHAGGVIKLLFTAKKQYV